MQLGQVHAVVRTRHVLGHRQGNDGSLRRRWHRPRVTEPPADPVDRDGIRARAGRTVRDNRAVTTTPRRRILLASQPLDAGVPRHVLDLVACLEPSRFEIAVACPTESTLWRGLEAMPWVARHALGAERAPSPADTVSLSRLLRLVADADVVHGHSAKAGFLVRLAAAVRGRTARCVFTPHGWSFWAAQGAAARTYLGLERRAARWCRRIVAVSEHERDAGLTAGVGRFDQYRVIRNGVDLSRFDACRRPWPAGSSCSPGWRRRSATTSLCARSRSSGGACPRLSCTWSETGPEGPPSSASRPSSACVTPPGCSARAQTCRSCSPTAHCVLLASDYEGCPLSVLEAMAAGVPVVATAVGGVPEIVADGETGLLTPRGDAQALARALETVLADRDLAMRFGAEGRARARRELGRERMGAEVVALYDELLA